MLDQANEIAKNVFEFMWMYLPLWCLSAFIFGLISLGIAIVKEIRKGNKKSV